ncbi:MAG: hypothetical protein MHM6MM_007458 [Cercozoa sp. M6MM]
MSKRAFGEISAGPEGADDDVETSTVETGSSMETVRFHSELLPMYFGSLYPWFEVFRWLSAGHDPRDNKTRVVGEERMWTHREFSFTLADGAYLRYKSFDDVAEMRADALRLAPHKLDIGAVYSHLPKSRKNVRPSEFKPLMRELVFDVDINDYDDIRLCCQGAKVCDQCWPLMSCAIEIVTTALKEDFGFKHFLAVFSGRRGVHVWCCDRAARELDDQSRSALVEYLNVFESFDPVLVQCGSTFPHHSLTRAYNVCRRYMLQMDPLASDSLRRKLIEGAFPVGSDLRDRLLNSSEWKKFATAEQRIEYLENTCLKKNRRSADGRRWLYALVFRFCYPRLDLEVSKHRNHLLKAPFVVHPKTGLVCTPIDHNNLGQFSPLQQPDLVQLTDELANARKDGANVGDASSDDILGTDDVTRGEWRLTSLEPHVTFFRQRFLKPLLMSERAQSARVHEPMTDW